MSFKEETKAVGGRIYEYHYPVEHLYSTVRHCQMTSLEWRIGSFGCHSSCVFECHTSRCRSTGSHLYVSPLSRYLHAEQAYTYIKRDHPVTSCAQNVHHRPKCTLPFSDIFPKQLIIFSPNFTCLLNVHIYARMQIFVQLSPTVTKLRHIKCDHPACVSVDGGHFEHINVA